MIALFEGKQRITAWFSNPISARNHGRDTMYMDSTVRVAHLKDEMGHRFGGFQRDGNDLKEW